MTIPSTLPLDFDPCAPFPMGISLLEASAGTGKTYSISNIVLRLVAESDQAPIDRILVVTFTEAATAELRERIRSRLREALLALECPDSLPPDVLKNPVINALRDRTSERLPIITRLRQALLNFDQACISTIHGFCRRLLAQNAFESGAPFEQELVPSHDGVLERILEDFWTTEFHDADPLWLETVDRKSTGCDRERLSALGKAVTADLRLELVPQPAGDDTPPDFSPFLEARAALAAAWSSGSGEAVDLVTAATAKDTPWKLDGRSYRIKSIPTKASALHAWLQTEGVALKDAAEILRYFSLEQLASKTKGGSAPAHPVFVEIDRVLEALHALEAGANRAMLHLKHRFCAYVRKELDLRKNALRQQSFDDLLVRVHQGLQSPLGPQLKESIRSSCAAALIDEFQDTNRIQWEIFETLFNTDTHRLFLIGDPKQAIYGFRGAEIFTYLAARAQTPTTARFNLLTNYRSDEGLVDTINGLFACPPGESATAGGIRSPFVFDAFSFPPVGANHTEPRIHNAPGGDAPFHFRLLQRDEATPATKKGPGAISVTRARKQVAAQTAKDIIALLRSDATLDSGDGEPRPLRPGDIAVLVRTHPQAALIQETLRECGIPTVQHGSHSVFDTEEATDLRCLLEAALEPGRHALIKRALATRLFGLRAERLRALQSDDAGWVEWLETFSHWNRIWREQGFIHLFRAVLDHTDVYPRVLSWQDGERRLTNLRHLGELLQTAASRQALPPAALVLWLQEQRLRPSGEEKNRQLRLETDSDALEIVTIHGSKGLEYPVVFCPCLWDPSDLRPDDRLHTRFFNEDAGRYQLDVSLTDSPARDANLRLASRELLAENLRLLYVALTRASVRCVVYWGGFGKAASSPLAYLLHQPPVLDEDNPVEDLLSKVRARFPSLTDDALLDDLQGFAQRLPGRVEVTSFQGAPLEAGDTYTPEAPTTEALTLRRFTRSDGLDSNWGRSSFSHMVSGPRAALPGPDAEGVTTGEDHHRPEGGALSATPEGSGSVPLREFPRGAVPGTFLHRILELWDFSSPDPAPLEALIDREASRLDFFLRRELQDWTVPLGRALLQCAQSPLGLAHDPGFRLADLQRSHRLDELTFDFPVQGGLRGRPTGPALTSGELARVFKQSPECRLPAAYLARLRSLGFIPLRGFLTGAVDLIFVHQGRWYLADYKSNHLGNTFGHYHPGALAEEMGHHHYYLQYHLYAVALHRFLRWKLGERYRSEEDYARHFGGVLYLFLRGMDGETPGGVYRDLPPYELIEALSARLDATSNARLQGAPCQS